MSSLADVDSSKYLRVGDHLVTIYGLRFFDYNSGTRGVEFECRRGTARCKLSYCLHPKALWKLRGLAEDCGMSVDEMKRIDCEREDGFDLFVNRSVIVTIGKNDKGYSEVIETSPAPIDGERKPPPIARQAAAKKNTAQPAAIAADAPPRVDQDGIPF